MRNFPGTVSLSLLTFCALVQEILAEYVRHGARKLALIGGHAEPAQDAAVREAALPLVNTDPTLTILYIGPYDFTFGWNGRPCRLDREFADARHRTGSCPSGPNP